MTEPPIFAGFHVGVFALSLVKGLSLDPTSGNGGTAGFYSTNLIRSMVGFNSFGQMPTWTYKGTSSYNALQVQLNRRMGRLQR